MCCGFSLNSGIHLQLTVKVSSHLRFTVQWLADSIFVLGHDAEHILVSRHQVLHGPDSLLGLICDRNPGLPGGNSSPNNVVCDFRATIILRRQPGKCDPLRANLLKLNGSRGRTGPAYRTKKWLRSGRSMTPIPYIKTEGRLTANFLPRTLSLISLEALPRLLEATRV